MLHGRTRLLLSGSKDRFRCTRTLRFIAAIRGVHLFAPYHRLSSWTTRSPTPGQPTCPLLRDDPKHVGQVAAAFATAFLDGQQPKLGRFPNGVLHHPATDPSAGRNLVYASIAVAVLANLIPDNAQHRQLADGELAGERRRHGTGRGEVSATGYRDRALRSSLESPRREDRRSARWNAYGLEIA